MIEPLIAACRSSLRWGLVSFAAMFALALSSFGRTQICLEGTSIPTLAGPSVAAASLAIDVDSDGLIDIVTADFGVPEINVLRNVAEGLFAPAVRYPTGGGVRTLVAADLEGDGDLDLVVACTSPTGFAVLLNESGVFAQPVLYPTGAVGPCIAVADYDQDDDLDLAFAHFTEQRVAVYRNDGSGAFAPLWSLPFSHQTQHVLASDLNGDGSADLVVLAGGKIRMLLNRDDGTFVEVDSIFCSAIRTIMALDLDGDLDTDLAFARTTSTVVEVIRNRGDGTYENVVTWPVETEIHAFTAGDIDLDGDIDLVSVGYDGGRTLLNQGNGTFASPRVFTVNSSSTVLACIDADEDGDADLFVGGAASHSIVSGRGDGEFSSPKRLMIPEPIAELIAADFDGDASPDLVVRTHFQRQYFVKNSDGAYSEFDLIGTPGIALFHLRAGDVDGDGDTDLLGVAGGQIGVHENRGGGSFAALRVDPTPWLSKFELADFDGDGDADAISIVVNQGIRIDWNVGGIFQTSTHVPLGIGAHAVVPGDFDRDGLADVACITMEANCKSSVVVYSNRSGGDFVPGVELSTGEGRRALIAADLDGDGSLDLVSPSSVTLGCELTPSDVAVMMNDGSGVFTQVVHSSFERGEHAAAGDVDGDGDPDLVMLGPGNVSILENVGHGIFRDSVRVLIHQGAAQSPPAVVDFDGDGDADIAIGTEIATLVRSCAVSSAPICVGDGLGQPCPCGNDSPQESGAGCRNSLDMAGRLEAAGAASIASDRLVLHGTGMPNSTAIYFHGTHAIPAQPFGDGLRCVGGLTVRIATKQNMNNASHVPDTGEARISSLAVISRSGTSLYQVWYRDDAAYCTTAASNFTNGVRVVWAR